MSADSILNSNVRTGDEIHHHYRESIPAAAGVEARNISMLPRTAAPVFVGRAAALAELEVAMHQRGGVIGQSVAGLGGVGKSELALQFARRHASAYTAVFWLVADSAAALVEGLSRVANQLVPGLQATPEAAAVWALEWLRLHPGWLMVLDNVERPSDVEKFLANSGRGHVMVTTRRDVDWSQYGLKPVRLETLTVKQAVDLLLRTTGQTDTSAARRVAKALGCLPLALRQAAAYVQQARIRLAGYADRLESDTAEAIDEIEPFEKDEQERAITRVWRLTLEALRDEDPLTLELLDVLSWLAPDDVPRDLVDSFPLEGTARANRLLGRLRSYSMITLTDDTVSIHRLVQLVLRRGQLERTDSGLAPAAARAVALLRGGAPGRPIDDMDGWPRWWALLPHVQTLADAVDDTCIDGGLVRLLNQAGLFASGQGQHAVTARLAKLALAIARRMAVPSVGMPTLLGNLGAAQSNLGHYADAVALEEEALRLAEDALGPNHVDLVTRLSNLATTYDATGRPANAVDLLHRAVRIAESQLGPQHRQVAECQANLAAIYRGLGRTREALPLQHQAIAIIQQEYHERHVIVAYRISDLAASHRDLGQFAEALDLGRRALGIAEEALRADHPDLAGFLGGLGATYAALGEPEEARKLEQRALDIVEAACGPEHPDVAARLGNLANTLRELDRFEEALKLEERATRITEDALGPDHPHLAIRLGSLANNCRALGRPEEARRLDLRALNIAVSQLGAEHPDVAARLSGLASSLVALDRYEEAVRLLRRAVTIFEDAYGSQHVDLAPLLANLADAYRRLGRPADALPHSRRALLITRNAVHDGHPDVVIRLEDLAGNLRELGRRDEAVPLLKGALRIVEIERGPEHPSLLGPLDGLADVCRDTGDFAQLVPLMERALRIAEAAHGPGHPRVNGRLALLGNAYYRAGRYPDAAVVEERALAGAAPDVELRRLDNLAATYSQLDRGDDEATLRERAVETARREHGDGEELLLRLHRLETVYEGLGRYEDNIGVCRRGVDLAAALHGSKTLVTASWLGRLGHAYFQSGRPDLAAPFEEQALAITDVSGADARLLAVRLSNLAASYVLSKRHGDALPLRLRALRLVEGETEPDQDQVLECLDDVVESLRSLERLAEAVPLHRRAIVLAEARHGPDDLAVAWRLGLLGNTYFRNGDEHLGIPVEERALRITETALGLDHVDLVLRLTNLAASYRAVGRSADAGPLLRRAYRIAMDNYPPGHPTIADIRERLGGD